MDEQGSSDVKESTRVADELRRQIYKGQLRTGDKLLSEKDLLTHFSVSRPTLREALRLLESEDLITIMRGGGGARVRPAGSAALTRQVGGYLQRQGASLEDIYAARLQIEPLAAGLLATNATREAIVALEANIADGYAAIGDIPRFDPLIVAFSRLVTDHCGNKTLALFGGVIQQIIQSQIVFMDTTLIYDAAKTLREKEHRNLDGRQRLVAAVKERDSDLATGIWRQQLTNTGEDLLSAYRSQMPIEAIRERLASAPGQGDAAAAKRPKSSAAPARVQHGRRTG